MDRVPFNDLKRQYLSIKEEIDKAIEDVVQNTSFIMGEEVSAFEQNFAGLLGIQHVSGVSSGTSALLLALLALGVGPGDKVITTPNTFIATVEPLILLGAEPIFTDIDEHGGMDVNGIEDLIDDKVRGVIAVHIYGRMSDVVRIKQICDSRGLFLVEDCAQSHLAEYEGKKAGTVGDVSTFSFYPGKNLGAFGDAGAVATNNNDLFEKVHMIRNHGRKTKYEHSVDGLGERLDTLQAAILNVKLKYLQRWTDLRISIAGKYNDALKDIQGIKLPESNGLRSVFHLYVMQVYSDRDRFLSALRREGIMASIHYPVPLHLQPVYRNRNYGAENVSLPASEAFAKRIISLPIFPEMTDAEIKRVTDTVQFLLESE